MLSRVLAFVFQLLSLSSVDFMSRIGHIWIPVSRLERSVAFYTEKLGLEMRLMVRAGEEYEPRQKARG